MRILNLLAVLGLGLAAGAVGVTHAGAATTCGTARNYFVGGLRAGTSTAPIYAVTTTLNRPNLPAMCGSSNSDSSAWAMLAGGGTSPAGYARSGYLRHAGNTDLYYFAEYHIPEVAQDVMKVTGVACTGTHYLEQYDFNLGRVNMMVGNTIVLSTSYDPILQWARYWQAQWFAETWNYGDDVVGTLAAPAYFSQLAVQNCRGCASIAPGTLQMGSTNARYGFSTDSDNKFHVYTK